MNMQKASTRTHEEFQTATHSGSALEVVVLFTHAKCTLIALRTAASLAAGLGAHIRVIAGRRHGTESLLPQRRFRTIVDGGSVETRLDIRLCADRWQMLREALTPHSIVVMGGCHPHPTDVDSRLVRQLQAAGHHVVLSTQSAQNVSA
jgi:hypothetical protein